MIIVAALLFFLPAGIANMVPILACKMPGLRNWNTPVDFGKQFRGMPLFGPHKTWRGIVCGTIVGGLIGLMLPYGFITQYYPDWSVAVAATMSFGALAGDAMKSFFKRRVGIKSGATWFPFDQLDYIIGGLLFVLPFGSPSLALAGTVCVSYFCLHIVSTNIGYRLGLKSSPL